MSKKVSGNIPTEKRDIHNWKVLLDETTRIILLDDFHPIEWKNMTIFKKKKNHWTHHPNYKSDKKTNASHLVCPNMRFVMFFFHQFCYAPETGDKYERMANKGNGKKSIGKWITAVPFLMTI